MIEICAADGEAMQHTSSVMAAAANASCPMNLNPRVAANARNTARFTPAEGAEFGYATVR